MSEVWRVSFSFFFFFFEGGIWEGRKKSRVFFWSCVAVM